MFDYERLSASKIVTIPAVEKVVEFSPPALDKDSVSKILSLAADCKCVTAAAFDGYCDIEGRANFRLIYLDADSAVKGVDYNADFSLRVDGEVSEGDFAGCALQIVEADAVMTDVLTLSAVVEASVTLTKREELEMLIDAEMCYKTTSQKTVQKLIASKTASLQLVEEINVGEVESVLMLDAKADIKAVSAGEGTVKIEGTAHATVTFTENGEIICRTMEIPFDEEISADGAAEGDRVLAEVSVKGGKIVLAGVTGDNIVKYEGEAVIRIQVFRESAVEGVEDIFMLTNEIEVSRTSSSFTVYRGSRSITERVTGTAVLGDNRAAARGVSALPYSSVYVTKSECLDEGLLVEGIVNTDIIYTDENGYNSVKAEIPFSTVVNGEFDSKVRAYAHASDVSARIKRDREIEVNVILCITADGYAEISADYISDVTVGAEKEQNTSALSLYIASEGEGLWDVCKALTATPESIMHQNPSLKTPLKEGDRIIYFRALAR